MTTKWLDVARKYEAGGVAEVPGPDSNPLILHWLQEDGGGKSWVKDDATPWCGAFMAGVFVEAGLRSVLPKGPLAAKNWLLCGEGLEAPRVGAVVVLPHHVGLVSSWDARNVYVLGGNQGDRVCTAPFPISTVVGYRWPIPAVKGRDLVGSSRIATAAERQKRDQKRAAISAGSGPVADSVPPAPKGWRESIEGLAGDVGWVQSVVGGGLDFASFVGGHLWLVALGVALYFLARACWDSHQIQQFRAQDHNEGWSQ